MKNPFLVGHKVYLRPLERSDAPALVPWLNDPEVTRFMLRYRPVNLQDEERFIDQMSQSEQDLGLLIVRRDSGLSIGVTGFHQMNVKNRNANWGIAIGDKDSWGQGFGTEATTLMMAFAFDTLNLHRVTLQVFEYNQRAIHIYEKLGFQREGVLRQESFRDGRYWDTIVMGLLREEWLKAKGIRQGNKEIVAGRRVSAAMAIPYNGL